MEYFDKAKEEFKARLQDIFKNDIYKKLEESVHSDKKEFNFSGEVEYTVKVENDGEYNEYYVYDGTGKIIEIFTDDMVDSDGILTSEIRKAIRDQYTTEVAPTVSDEVEDVESEDETDEEEEVETPDEEEEVETPDVELEGEPAEDVTDDKDDELEGEPVK